MSHLMTNGGRAHNCDAVLHCKSWRSKQVSCLHVCRCGILYSIVKQWCIAFPNTLTLLPSANVLQRHCSQCHFMMELLKHTYRIYNYVMML